VILFSGIRLSLFSNNARNSNPGSIWADKIFGKIPLIGLNGGSLKPCFRVPEYCASNPEPGVLRREKPTLIYPIGRPIGCPNDPKYGKSRGLQVGICTIQKRRSGLFKNPEMPGGTGMSPGIRSSFEGVTLPFFK
jgi:hypothetical protein